MHEIRVHVCKFYKLILIYKIFKFTAKAIVSVFLVSKIDS